MTVRSVPIGEFLTLIERDHTVDPLVAYPMMGVRSFGRGAFKSNPLSGSATSYSKLRKVQAGDIVYPKLMAWEGAFAQVPHELEDHWVSPEFCTFEIDESRACPSYIRHLISWEGFRDDLLPGSSGTNARRRRLNPKQFMQHVVPLPSLSEQQAASERLDRIERICVEILNANARLESAAQSLTNQVLNRISAAAVRAGDILELRRRLVDVQPDKEYREVGVRSFGRGLFAKPPLNGSELNGKRVYRVESEDLIISNVFAWEGAVAVAGSEHSGMIGSHRFMTWVPVSASVDVRFLRHYLTAERGLADLREASPGSAGRNKTLSIKKFEEIQIPLPDMSDQRRVVDLLDRLVALTGRARRRTVFCTALVDTSRNEVFSELQ